MYTQWNIAQTLKSVEFCHLQPHGWTWGVLCLVKHAKQRKTNTVWYHLWVESKKHRKPVSITKKEQTHKEQTCSFLWGEESGEGQCKGRRLWVTNYYAQNKL